MHGDLTFGLSIDSAPEKPASAKEIKIPLSPKWSRRLIIMGVLFDTASAFLPWGLSIHLYQLFLPWSPVWGDGYALPFEAPFTTISAVIRAAAGIGWTGVILYEHFKKRVVPYLAILVSVVFSLAALFLFTQTTFNLSWGAYLALFSGVLKLSGVLMETLEIEVIIERELVNSSHNSTLSTGHSRRS